MSMAPHPISTTQSSLTPVTVFWDIENCPVPSTMQGLQVVSAIKRFSLGLGVLKNISAFGNLKSIPQELRVELQESGVLLHEVATGKPNAADIAILVELLKLVCDNKPPHTIVLISGDRDFANVLNTLLFRHYSVYLVHSQQASVVLQASATASYEWKKFLTTYLQTQNETSRPRYDNFPDQPNINPTQRKYQPLINVIKSKERFGMNLSEIGGQLTLTRLKEFGYMKLKDYVIDAYNAGIVKFDPSLPDIKWRVFLNAENSSSFFPNQVSSGSSQQPSTGNGTPGLSSKDRKKIIHSLLTALASLEHDYFLPTEKVLKMRLRKLYLLQEKNLEWETVIELAQSKGFKIGVDQAGGRIIFPPSGMFNGVDPNAPSGTGTKFPERLWNELEQFFRSVHPIKAKGRYGFAEWLKGHGPEDISRLPLGVLTELVQTGIQRGLLRFAKTFIMTNFDGETSCPPSNPNSDSNRGINPTIPNTINGPNPNTSSPSLPSSGAVNLTNHPSSAPLSSSTSLVPTSFSVHQNGHHESHSIHSHSHLAPTLSAPSLSITSTTTTIATITTSSPTPYECDLCSIICPNEHSLQEHYKGKRHQVALLQPPPTPPSTPPTLSPISSINSNPGPAPPLLPTIHQFYSSYPDSDSEEESEDFISKGRDSTERDWMFQGDEDSEEEEYQIANSNPNRFSFAKSPSKSGSRNSSSNNSRNSSPTKITENPSNTFTTTTTTSSTALSTPIQVMSPKRVGNPVEFRWVHGGSEVYVTGSFNHWQEKIKLEKRAGHDPQTGEYEEYHCVIVYLLPGQYSYKYVVDGDWRYDPRQPITTDAYNNNWVLVRGET